MTDLGKKSVAVIRVDRDTLTQESDLQGVIANVQSLVADNWDVVIVHGGESQGVVPFTENPVPISLHKLHTATVESQYSNHSDIVALSNADNLTLVSEMQRQGINAFGCDGVSGGLISLKRHTAGAAVTKSNTSGCKYGAAQIEAINHKLLQSLLYLNLVPVISAVGMCDAGTIGLPYCDAVILEVARALQADVLLVNSVMGAMYRDMQDPESRIAELTRSDMLSLIAEGDYQDAAKSNLEEAVNLLDGGVEMIGVVSGSHPRAYVELAEGGKTFGTRIVA